MDSTKRNTDGTHGPLEGHPLLTLGPDDLDVIVQFVLQSGSLKALARSYGVSYPTIRARLDDLIDRLRAAMHDQEPDPLRDLLAQLVQRGELTKRGAHAIREIASTESRDGAAPTETTANTHTGERS